MTEDEPAAGLLCVTSQEAGRATVLTVAGELDYDTADELGRHITESLRHQPAVLVLDLTGITFMDSMGMSLFLGAHRDAPPHTSLRIVPGGRAVLGPLEIAGLDHYLPLCADLEHALA